MGGWSVSQTVRSYAPTLVFCEGFREARDALLEAGLKVVEVDMVKYAHVKHETSIFYYSLAERKGRQIAIVAAARKLLLCCYVLKNRKPYQDQAS